MMRLRRIEAGSYRVHGKPNLIVLAHFNDWAVWDNSRPWQGALFRGRTLGACREWLNARAVSTERTER